LGLKVY